MSKIQNETKSQLKTGLQIDLYVVYTMSKIQNETKSQLKGFEKGSESGCLYYVKDTK